VTYFYNKSQQDALFLNFILVNNSSCFGQTYCPSSGVLILYSQQLVFVILVMLNFIIETQGHNLNSLISKTWEPMLLKITQSFMLFPCCKFWNIRTMFHKKCVCMFLTLMPRCCFMYYNTAINWSYIFSNIYL